MNESPAATVSTSGVGWLPIAVYDALKKKPKYAVFYVKAQPAPGRRHAGLPEMIVTTRGYGNREITHLFRLPAPPATA